MSWPRDREALDERDEQKDRDGDQRHDENGGEHVGCRDAPAPGACENQAPPRSRPTRRTPLRSRRMAAMRVPEKISGAPRELDTPEDGHPRGIERQHHADVLAVDRAEPVHGADDDGETEERDDRELRPDPEPHDEHEHGGQDDGGGDALRSDQERRCEAPRRSPERWRAMPIPRPAATAIRNSVDHLLDRHPGVRTDLARRRRAMTTRTASASGPAVENAAEQLPQADREDHEQDRGA